MPPPSHPLLSRRTIVLATAALPLAWASVAHGDEADDVLRDLSRAREKMSTLVVTFTQERALGLLSTSVTSKGELTLVRPDRMRWELKPPDEAIYWVGPEGASYRTPHGRGKVSPGQAGALSAVLDDLMIAMGGDLTKLKGRYGISAEKRESGVSLTLTPKVERIAKVLKRLVLDLHPDLLGPKKLLLEESADDRTVVTFDAAQINVPVDAAKMKP
jgi:hypothetical protein